MSEKSGGFSEKDKINIFNQGAKIGQKFAEEHLMKLTPEEAKQQGFVMRKLGIDEDSHYSPNDTRHEFRPGLTGNESEEDKSEESKD